jgi:hypothetical protein
MKPFKYNGYRAKGELVVLKEPTTPFERGMAVVRIHSDCERGTALSEMDYEFDCVVKAFLPNKKDVHIVSQTAPYDDYRYADNEITFSFQY